LRFSFLLLIQPETDMASHPGGPRFGLVAANGCAVHPRRSPCGNFLAC
jgi:hypothetical protein